MPRLIDCEQRSAEWFQARCGRITGSCIADVMSYRKDKKESAARADYRLDLVAERLTGVIEESYVSKEMQWGAEQELEARIAYEESRDTMVVPVGFAIHPALDFTGASPDAMVDGDGILEIKWPKTTTHIEYMIGGVVPEEYRPQMIWEMVCCERSWGDFVSFDPRLEEGLRLFVVRYHFDEELAEKIEREVVKFNAEIDSTIDLLRNPRVIPMTLNDRLRASIEATV